MLNAAAILCDEKALPPDHECWKGENLRASGREFPSLAAKLAWCSNCVLFHNHVLPQYGGERSFLHGVLDQLKAHFARIEQNLRLKSEYQTVKDFLVDALDNVLLFATTADLNTLSQDDSIYRGLLLMADNNLRRVPVVASGGVLKGIITARDITRVLARDNRFEDLYKEADNNVDAVLAQPLAKIADAKLVTLSQNHAVKDAILAMVGKWVGGLPIVFGEKIIGLITERDVLYLFPLLESLAGTPRSIVPNKKVDTVKPSLSIREAIKIFAARSFRRLPVASGGKLVGIVTTADIIQANYALNQPYSKILDLPVEELMNWDPYSLPPGVTLQEAVLFMGKHRLGSLLIVEAGVVCGIVTERDVLRSTHNLFKAKLP